MNTVELTIDGRQVRAPEGSYLLAAARAVGVEIPTLCHHEALEPVGACRLCMVEVTHADWKGWSGLVTACIYPVQAGLCVSTHSERVIEARRGVLSLLIARAPNAQGLSELAGTYGASAAQLSVDEGADDCILCGLCTRVCETYATGAITTYSRGSDKRVGGFADRAPEECVGCGACASVCPTGEVSAKRDAGHYEVWQRTFWAAVAEVDAARCMGCGRCEEACPFHVARIELTADGMLAATIPEAHCRGCGACLGACPSGAISQDGGFDWATLAARMGGTGAVGEAEEVSR
jgi:bidirectional [NiFe] hydrogenase diaphorase subunit